MNYALSLTYKVYSAQHKGTPTDAWL